jgi:hypothetical protein
VERQDSDANPNDDKKSRQRVQDNRCNGHPFAPVQARALVRALERVNAGQAAVGQRQNKEGNNSNRLTSRGSN